MIAWLCTHNTDEESYKEEAEYPLSLSLYLYRNTMHTYDVEENVEQVLGTTKYDIKIKSYFYVKIKKEV